MAHRKARGSKKKVARKSRSSARGSKKVCKSSKCEYAGEPQPLANFPNSPHSDDGKMHYCTPCFGARLSAGRRRGIARRKKVEPSDVANKALERANRSGRKGHRKILVRASDGGIYETSDPDKAARKAVEWRMGGYKVWLYREVNFELTARIDEE